MTPPYWVAYLVEDGPQPHVAISAPPPLRHLIEAWEDAKSKSDWARDRRAAVVSQVIGQRMSRGWPAERAISLPVMHSREDGRVHNSGAVTYWSVHRLMLVREQPEDIPERELDAMPPKMEATVLRLRGIDVVVTPNGRGGLRPGAGRPRKPGGASKTTSVQLPTELRAWLASLPGKSMSKKIVTILEAAWSVAPSGRGDNVESGS